MLPTNNDVPLFPLFLLNPNTTFDLFDLQPYDPDAISIMESAHSVSLSFSTTAYILAAWPTPTPSIFPSFMLIPGFLDYDFGMTSPAPAIPSLVCLPQSVPIPFQVLVPISVYDISKKISVKNLDGFFFVGQVCTKHAMLLLKSCVFQVSHLAWRGSSESFMAESAEIWPLVLANREIEISLQTCNPPGLIEKGKAFLLRYISLTTFYQGLDRRIRPSIAGYVTLLY